MQSKVRLGHWKERLMRDLEQEQLAACGRVHPLRREGRD
jgi:hypothetical protein